MKKIINGLKKFNSGVFAVALLIFAILIYVPIRILFPTKIINKENLKKIKKEGGLVTPNHFSNFDVILYDVLFFKNTFKRKFLAKKELGEKKFSNFSLKSFGAIFIDRGTADRVAMKEVVSTLKDKKTVVMFPEGTRNKGDSNQMLELKSGVIFFARRADSCILPVRMEKPSKIFRKNKIIIGEPYKVDSSLKTEDSLIELEQKYEDLKQKLTKLSNKQKTKV